MNWWGWATLAVIALIVCGLWVLAERQSRRKPDTDCMTFLDWSRTFDAGTRERQLLEMIWSQGNRQRVTKSEALEILGKPVAGSDVIYGGPVGGSMAAANDNLDDGIRDLVAAEQAVREATPEKATGVVWREQAAVAPKPRRRARTVGQVKKLHRLKKRARKASAKRKR